MRALIFITLFFSYVLLASCTPEELEIDTSEQTTDSTTSHINGPNILENGGLEEWISLPNFYYDVPTDWLAHNNNNVKKNNKTKYEGNYSARMKSLESGSTARVDQLIPVTPGDKIRIRYKYYVEQWKENGARTYCYFRTKSTESSNISISELREFYTDDEYYIIRGGGYGKKYLPHSLNKWLTFDEIITVPPTAKYFVFGVNSYYGTTIYVDDCFVGVVTQQY